MTIHRDRYYYLTVNILKRMGERVMKHIIHFIKS